MRARPVRKHQDRPIRLESGNLQELSRYSINELKRWLKLNQISQPPGQSKYECMLLVHAHFTMRTPSPASFSRVAPRRPSVFGTVHKKCVPKTPGPCFQPMNMDDSDEDCDLQQDETLTFSMKRRLCF